MGIRASSGHFDHVDEPARELEIAVVTYTGDRSTYQDNAMRAQGHWPSNASFTPGIPQVAVMPDDGLGWFERRNDFDIEYGQEAAAAAFLEDNYLPPDVFGASPNPRVRDMVLDYLGFDHVPRDNREIRERLAEIAGLEGDEYEAEKRSDEESTFRQELETEHTRSDLKDAAEELREDASDIELTSGKLELAEWLDEYDDEDAVRAALRTDDGDEGGD